MLGPVGRGYPGGMERATVADAGPLAAVLAAAFEADPVFEWLLPPTDRLDRLRTFFALELRHVVLPRGVVHTDRERRGASLELPPDAWRLPLREQALHGRTFARAFGRRLPRAFALLTLLERRHPREPHLYIPYVGVAPEAQGAGLGTALMRPTLARCDEERLPAYLEATSERNRALYERLGFAVTGEVRLRDSPPLWPMRREAGQLETGRPTAIAARSVGPPSGRTVSGTHCAPR